MKAAMCDRCGTVVERWQAVCFEFKGDAADRSGDLCPECYAEWDAAIEGFERHTLERVPA
jgi:hypothetical protein